MSFQLAFDENDLLYDPNTDHVNVHAVHTVHSFIAIVSYDVKI